MDGPGNIWMGIRLYVLHMHACTHRHSHSLSLSIHVYICLSVCVYDVCISILTHTVLTVYTVCIKRVNVQYTYKLVYIYTGGLGGSPSPPIY